VAARTLVIVNPSSGNGTTGRRWRTLVGRVEGALGKFEVEATRGPRDAERIAREGVRAGVERVIVAGGDGTLNEVVSGLLGAGLAGYAQVGVLPLGTGGDFARSLGLPRDFDAALAVIAAGKTRSIDAGRVEYRGAGDRPAVCHFANVASLGISGLVDRLVNRTTKRFGGTVSFAVGSLKGLALYRSASVTLRVDGEVVHDGPLVLATAANGHSFGGGMRVAPRARLDDGLLDVVVVPDLPKPQLLALLRRGYSGAHLDDPRVGFWQGRELEADAGGAEVLLDVDGEPLGELPARFTVVPSALEVIGGFS
jgi:diacylglycerol kinase (ATP)